jgi:hypothetical protein
VVERGPEKAGVGGSIPSLATTPFPFPSIQSALCTRAQRSGMARGPERPSRRRFNPVSGHHYFSIQFEQARAMYPCRREHLCVRRAPKIEVKSGVRTIWQVARSRAVRKM